MKQEDNWYAHAQWLSDNDLGQFGKTLIIAPHQDDESLGCGGTIALLRKAGIPVHAAFISDGSMSHAHSKKYPYKTLVALRETEAINALQILGVDKQHISFLRLQDSKLPDEQKPDFQEAVYLVKELLLQIQPQTILLPWRRDPHKDHRATWQIVDHAAKEANKSIRKLEYLIWLWERGNVEDLPQTGECKVWKINIEQTLLQKKNAVAAHISQTTSLIDDDPQGFTLSAEVLAHFDKTEEIFIEIL